MTTQPLLTRTLLEMADTLVEDFDLVDLLTLLVSRSVEILDIAAAGLMLGALNGQLRLAASSSEVMRVVESFELQSREGPCLDSFERGEPVLNEMLVAGHPRWPAFAPVALEAGFRCVHAVPLRLRGRTIGALNLFADRPDELSPADVLAAQTMADMATIAILQHRAALEAQTLNTQLNHALTSRILVEQAKGVLAERLGVDMTEAFERLRQYSRRNNLRLAAVAQGVIDGDATLAGVLASPASET